MKKKFLINLGLLVFINLLVKPFWVFGIEISVQNYVGSFEYGILFPLFNLSVILNILLDLGINNFNNRAVSQDQTLAKTYLPHIVILKFLLAILYGVLIFIIAWLLGYGKRQLLLLSLLALNQFANSFLYYFRSNLSGMQFYTTDSILSILDRAMMIVICMLAYWNNFWGKQVTIEGFVFIQTVSYMVCAIIVMWIVFLKTGKIFFTINRLFIFKILKSGLPFALLIFLMAIYSRIDAIMLEKLLPDGNYQAGIYAQSFRILDAAAMLGILFAGLLYPMFSNLTGNKQSVEPLMRISFHLIWVIAVSFSVSSMFYADKIIPLLYHEGVNLSVKVFEVLILCFIPISAIHIFGTLLTANGNLKILNIIASCSIVLNVVLNFVLIPQFDSKGAAISGLITQSIVAIAQIITVNKIFGTTFIHLSKIAFFTLISVLVSFLISKIEISWAISFIVSGCIMAIIGLLFGLLPFRELMAFLNVLNSPKN